MLCAMKTLIRWMLLAAALILITHWDSHIEIRSYGAAMAAALVIGLLNAFVRPLLIILTLPVTVLTLGVFLLVINALMFELASHLLSGFVVQGFANALVGSILYSLWSMVIDAALERLMGRPRLP